MSEANRPVKISRANEAPVAVAMATLPAGSHNQLTPNGTLMFGLAAITTAVIAAMPSAGAFSW